MKITPVLFLVLVWCAVGPLDVTAADRPNVVIIYADDLGYGDLGCFGAEDIRTPHIDRLAAEGVRFTDFYAASSVCTPSRAALLTGRIPQRMGIVGVYWPSSYTGMPVAEYTMAEMLRDAGYTTGMVGKWHLGHRREFLPTQRGFDEYFGIPYSNDMASVVYLENNDVVEFEVDQHYTTRTYTERAVDFIERSAGEPFFLYLAHSMPHVPIYASPEFEGTSERGLYGDVIQEIDWSVGEVVAALEAAGVRENTLIVFTSDNGPWWAMRDHGGSNGPLREGKMFTFDGGMRVPTVVSWPAGARGGRSYSGVATMMDWMVTVAELAGTELPADRDYDGESLMAVLAGTGERGDDRFLYYENLELQGYREGDWKIKLPWPGFKGARWKHRVAGHDLVLFNLRDDPGESQDLAAAMPEKVAEMRAAMEAMHASKQPFADPIPTRSMPDEYHYRHVAEKYGPEPWVLD